MKLNRTSLIVLIVATLLAGVVVLQQTSGRQEESSGAQPLFAFQEADVQSFSLKTPEQLLAFVRKPAPNSSQWQMTAPNQVPASEASVAYLLNAIAALKIPPQIKVPRAKGAEFGFEPPLATMDLTLKDSKTHRLIFGQPDFNRTMLYAQVDPKPGADLTILLIPLYFENAVSRPIAEWQQAAPKPSAPNVSPSAMPTPKATKP
jgi:hypothetical protein